MKNMIRFQTTAIVLLLTIQGVFAGIHNESFIDYSGFDALRSDARWDIFNRRLTLHETPHRQFPNLLDAVTMPDGGFAVLYVWRNDGVYTLLLNRHDATGNPMWPAHVVVTSSAGGLYDAALASSGDGMVVVWRESDPVQGIFARRFDLTGVSLWSEPVQVNRSVPGNSYQELDAAAAPGGGTVVVWTDRRADDTYYTYAQKLDSAGIRLWNSADVRVQPGGAFNENQPRVACDADGRAYVVWIENDDLLMNRVGESGVPAWTHGALLTADASNLQDSPVPLFVDGFGLLVSYREKAGMSESVEMVARDSNGNPLWPADLVVKQVSGRMDNGSLVATGSGIISAMGSSYEGFWRPYTRLIAWDGSPVGADVTPVVLPDIESYGLAAHLMTGDPLRSPGMPGMIVQLMQGERFLNTWFTGLTETGVPAWDQAVRLEHPRGVPAVFDMTMSAGWNDLGGFEIIWADTRDSDIRYYARHLTGSLDRTGDRDIPIDHPIWVKAHSARAPDGSVYVAHVNYTGASFANPFVELMRFDAGWAPMWPEWRTVSDPVADPNGSELRVMADAVGRAAVAWEDYRGGATDLRYQLLDTAGTRLLPSDLSLAGPGAFRIDDIVMDRFADGSIAIAWQDDHADGEHIYYNRIYPEGTTAHSPAIRLDSDPSIRTENPSLVVFNELPYIAFNTRETGAQRVLAVAVFSGTPTPEFLVAGPFETVRSVWATTVQPETLAVVWASSDGGTTDVWAQRISGGTLLWDPARVNASTVADSMDVVDLVATAPNKLAVLFKINSEDDQGLFRLQVLDGDGNRMFGEDQEAIYPMPFVRSSGRSVSSPLASGDPAPLWAAISHADAVLNGGSLDWYLSPDGGASWYPTAPGDIVVFAGAATDLRWRADLVAEPAQQQAPLIRSIGVVWGNSAPFTTTDLDLNLPLFRNGDPFRLDLHLISSGGQTVDVYVILDVYGSYWFWPEWTPAVDFVTMTPSTGVMSSALLEFTWPAVDGAATGLRFWAGALTSGTAIPAGDIDGVEFAYE